jgi:zinc protease
VNPILTVTFSLRAIALSTLAALPATPAPQSAAPRKWEHESSDLKPSPLVHFGALPNGMRYAWVAPKGIEDKGVSLRLHVNVGSLVEQDPEQGIAHFLEHMAFNGTKNFKAGTLVTWFQDHGVRFGRDVNANTSSTQTVYELDLPDAEGERFKKAFLWFRDVADGLLLEEAARRCRAPPA